MEEQILKIILTKLNKSDYICVEENLASKEIAEHFEKFIEWYMFGGHPFITWNDEGGNFLTDEITDKRYSIKELYSYWLKNVDK